MIEVIYLLDIAIETYYDDIETLNEVALNEQGDDPKNSITFSDHLKSSKVRYLKAALINSFHINYSNSDMHDSSYNNSLDAYSSYIEKLLLPYALTRSAESIDNFYGTNIQYHEKGTFGLFFDIFLF